MPRFDILERKSEILQWIDEGKSKNFISQQLKCKPETLNSYLQKMGIEYKGMVNNIISTTYIPAKEYFNQEKSISSAKLKEKLLKENYKEAKCECCGLTEWLNQPITLELHHKDGNHSNNELNNLELLCPNCHSYTEGFRNKSIQKPKEKTKFCADCGKPISKRATRCRECEVKNRTSDKPITRQELKQLIRTKPFIKIGEQFGISDNAIRKWCDSYGLPRKSTEIKKYTDEEWELI